MVSTLNYYSPTGEELWDYSQHEGDVPSATCLGDGSTNNPCRHCVIDNVNGEDRDFCYQTTENKLTGVPTNCVVEGPGFIFIASEHLDVCSTGNGIGYSGPHHHCFRWLQM